MKNLKLSLAAIAFVAAAGIAGAGNVTINGQAAGTYTGMSLDSTGNISLLGDIDVGTAPICTTDTSNQTGCQTEPTDDCTGGGDVDLNLAGCQEPAGGNEEPTDSTPTSCTGIPTPGQRSGLITSFSQFPGFQNEIFDINLADGDYLAIKFTAPAAGSAGFLGTETFTSYPGGGTTFAFSRCPGDFAQTVPAEGVCKTHGGVHRTWWSTRLSHPEDGLVACMLQPGETYYLNIMYAKDPNMSIDTCGSFRCGNLVYWNIYFTP